MRLALVAREFYPFVGGGIAPIVAAAARQLASVAEVTVVTSADSRAEYERLSAEGDPRLPPESVRVVFVEEPDPAGWGAYLSYMHSYSARVYRALREAYPEGGPDVIEVCDYLAEGFVTAQANHTCDPWLENTRLCVRLHTTSYICAVLDGHLPSDFHTTAIFEAERYVLRHADMILWSGGDVLDTYRRIYGSDNLAPALKLPDAFLSEHEGAAAPTEGPGDYDLLRLLYFGRLERRKGVQNLVRAVTGLERANAELTLLGGDTETAPLDTSLRAQLGQMAADDPRIQFVDRVPRPQVAEYVARSHAVVIPSLWECWPNTGREALMLGRPIIATPVGGLTEMVQPGRSGWLAEDRSAEALRDVIRELAAQPVQVRELISSGGPRQVFHELVDPDALRRGYLELAGRTAPTRTLLRRATPLVSIVVPYFRLERFVDETLASAAAQSYPRIELVIVNDGSLRPDDELLFELAERYGAKVVTQANAGLGPARNFGISQSLGRYVVPLDADDMIEPEFVERCVRALERDPDLAYATTWVAYVDPEGNPASGEDGGYMPFGNWSELMQRNNVAGSCTAVIRRELLGSRASYSADLTSYEDWFLYLRLHEAGRYGAVIPERLIRYRVRPESMMRTVGAPRLERLFDELRAHRREESIAWSPVELGGR